MQKFYFTFGSSTTFPYQNGWIIINAKDKQSACDYFRKIFPNPRDEDIVNCAFIYSEEEFKDTIMYRDDSNLGANCHGEFTTE